MKQFYCVKHKAKLKHDADVCQHACDDALSVIKNMWEYSMHDQQNIPSKGFPKLEYFPVSSDFLYLVEPEINKYLSDLLNSCRRIISGWR